MSELNNLQDILPLLLPIIVVQLALIVVALRDLMRRRTVRGEKWMWVIIIVFVNMLGPILYFVLGRQDE
jgi:hypothetical protein